MPHQTSAQWIAESGRSNQRKCSKSALTLRGWGQIGLWRGRQDLGGLAEVLGE